MIKCPACQTENSDDTKFCKKCGLQISEGYMNMSPQKAPLTRCPKCGKDQMAV